jgi:hypothetical protein
VILICLLAALAPAAARADGWGTVPAACTGIPKTSYDLSLARS